MQLINNLVLFYLVVVTSFLRVSYKPMKTKTFASRNRYSLKRNNCIPHWVRRSFSPAHSSIKKTRSPNSCQNRILRPRCHYVLNNKTKHPSLPWFTVFSLFHILWYSESSSLFCQALCFSNGWISRKISNRSRPRKRFLVSLLV